MAKHEPRPVFVGKRLICSKCGEGLRGQSAPVPSRWYIGADDLHEVPNPYTLFRPTWRPA